ncbi:MAG: UDP-3-O-acyl-N-acetylglucosamine deacetylase, partial [Pseudomonadota bacterium]
IVIDGDRVLNKNGLRFPDEFVRHKALDVVGDLSLAGHRLMARVSAFKPGHGLNNSILRALFADNTAWRYGSDNAGKTSAAIDDYTPPMVVNY